MRTSLHTSVSRSAVRLRISLCLIVGKPPLAHDRACSVEKALPQSQFLEYLLDSGHISMLGHLGMLPCVKPCSDSGSAVSHEHEEAPFSLARSIALCRVSGRS